MYGGRIVSEGSPSGLKQEVEQEAGVLLELITDKKQLVRKENFFNRERWDATDQII
jgi:hypothetical protein